MRTVAGSILTSGKHAFVEIWSWKLFFGHSLPSAYLRRALKHQRAVKHQLNNNNNLKCDMLKPGTTHLSNPIMNEIQIYNANLSPVFNKCDTNHCLKLQAHFSDLYFLQGPGAHTLVAPSLVAHLNSHYMLYYLQHGFRAKRSWLWDAASNADGHHTISPGGKCLGMTERRQTDIILLDFC